MTYTTHGYMTPLDLADHHRLHDTHRHPHCPGHGESGWIEYCSAVVDCPGESTGGGEGPVARMGTYERGSLYRALNGHHRLTPAQRRRMVKKAAREGWHITVDARGVKQLAF